MTILADEDNWLAQLLNKPGQSFPAGNLQWLAEIRKLASQQLESASVPDRKREAWRYTPTGRLMQQHFKEAMQSTDVVDRQQIQQWFTPGLDAYRLIFINGRCCPGCCDIKGLPKGVHIGSLQASLSLDEDVLNRYIGKVMQQCRDIDPADDVFQLLNQAMLTDGLFVHLADNIVLDKPLEVIQLQQSREPDSILSQSRGLVVLQPGARASLIEKYVSDDGVTGFCNSQTEILLHESAVLHHYRLQLEGRQAFHMGGLHLSQAANSQYAASVFSIGAAWSRTEINTCYSGEMAETRLQGVLLADDQQTSDIHLDIKHNRPACQSDTNFRGLLHGSGRIVFDGRILVAKDAQKTEAHLANNNLMLSREAEVDTKPQLEILADDVKCSHGTTVGEIDEQQVFYLRSRGVDEARARLLLSLGFVAELIEQVAVEPVAEALLAAIELRLEKNLSALAEASDTKGVN